jgi:hypothetical protein
VVNPVIDVVGDNAVVMVAVKGPLTCVQVPMPPKGVLAAITTDPVVVHIVCVAPALEAGDADTEKLMVAIFDVAVLLSLTV